MKKLFISHCSDDASVISEFRNLIESRIESPQDADYKVFYSSKYEEGVGSGNDIITEINQNISDSDLVILIASPNYVKSMYCLYEMSCAKFLNKTIIPIVSNQDIYNELVKILGNMLFIMPYKNKEWFTQLIFVIEKALEIVIKKDNLKSNGEVKLSEQNARSYIGAESLYKDTIEYLKKNCIIAFSGTSMSGSKICEKLRGANTIYIYSTTGVRLLAEIKNELDKIIAGGSDLYYIVPDKSSDFIYDVASIEKVNDVRAIETNYMRLKNEFDTVVGDLLYLSKKVRLSTEERKGHIYLVSAATGLRQTITLVDGYHENPLRRWGFVSMTMPPNLTKIKTPAFEFDTGDIPLGNGDVRQLDVLIKEHLDATVAYARSKNNVIDVDALSEKELRFVGFNHVNRLQEEAIAYWTKQKEDAMVPMQLGAASRILIEVAAQHPLIDGCEPNDEFRARLDKAIEYYNRYKDKVSEIRFYIPGSLHEMDAISLSEAGKDYLIANGINKDLIFAEDANQ